MIEIRHLRKEYEDDKPDPDGTSSTVHIVLSSV